MRADTKKRKNATQMLRATQEQEWWADQVVQVMLKGKRALVLFIGLFREVLITVLHDAERVISQIEGSRVL